MSRISWPWHKGSVKSPRAASAMVIVILVMVGMTVVPAASASPTPEGVPDLAIAGPRGRFHGENIVTPEPDARQIVSGSVCPGGSSWFSVSLRNVGSGDDSFDLRRNGRRRWLHGSVLRPSLCRGDRRGGGRHVGCPWMSVVGPRCRSRWSLRTTPTWAMDGPCGSAPSSRTSATNELVRGHATVPPPKAWAASFDGNCGARRCSPIARWSPDVSRTCVCGSQCRPLHDHVRRSSGLSCSGTRTGTRWGASVPPPFPRPGPIPVTLKPGHSAGARHVRRQGPVERPVVRDGAVQRRPLRDASRSVAGDAVPEAPASTAAAIDAAVGVSGSPWQVCHPGPAGQPATVCCPRHCLPTFPT